MSPNRTRIYSAKNEGVRRHKPDYLLVMLATVLCGVGLILIVAISPALSAQNDVSGSFYVVRQLVALLIGAVLFAITSRLDLRLLSWLRTPLIVASTLAVGAVLAISGIAFRWIQIGGMSFQPAELIKFTIVITLSWFLARQAANQELDDDRKTLWPIAIGVGAAVFAVMILERDLGSTMVMAAIVLAMLFMANVPLRRIGLATIALLVVASLAIMSTPYRRDRFMTFMNPERDCSTTGYHACQALIAVGSGGLVGLGVGNSIQAYGYLPEAANDSIFAIYAEKFGFIGSVLLVALFGFLFMRIVRIVKRAPDVHQRLLATGVLAWLSSQTIINIGAMIGLMPLKGITLPFISYGGTSLMFVLGALGLVFRISGLTLARRSVFSNRGEDYDDNRSGRWRDSRSRYAATRSR